jgi:hypothetical protein
MIDTNIREVKALDKNKKRCFIFHDYTKWKQYEALVAEVNIITGFKKRLS